MADASPRELQAPPNASLEEALRYARAWRLALKHAKSRPNDATNAMREISALVGLEEARRAAHAALDRHIDASADE